LISWGLSGKYDRRANRTRISPWRHRHPTYISGIERGVRNPSWDKIVEIASALSVQRSKLVELAERIELRA